nr:hypothetical protein [Pandoravirus aubagnensis]
MERLRSTCLDGAGDVALLQALAKGAHITIKDPVSLCATLVAIYEPLWSRLAPIYKQFPVLYALLGRPPTPASIAQAVAVLAPDLDVDAEGDSVDAVWRVAAEADARRWANTSTKEWRARAGSSAFEGAYEAYTAMAPYETRRPTMVDLATLAPSYEAYDPYNIQQEQQQQQQYYLAATRNGRDNNHPIVALLLAGGRVLASMACRRAPDARGALECATDITRYPEAMPADASPYMRDLLNDDRALGALFEQIAVPVAFGGLYGPAGAVLRDLWEVAPVARSALLNNSRPGARWLVAELDKHRLATELETERGINQVMEHLDPLTRDTPTLALRSARALARGSASTVLLSNMTAPDEVKALIAAQRVAQTCGRAMTPDDMPYLVDAADALGLQGDLTLELLGPFQLCHDATDAAVRVLERHRAMAANN